MRLMVAKQYEHPEVRREEHQALLDRSAAEGNLHEYAVKVSLQKQGFEVWGEQHEFRIQVLPGVWLVGHGDGFISRDASPDPNREIHHNILDNLLEIKSMSSAQFAKWLSGRFNNFERYAYQISSYMAAEPDRDVTYLVKRREDGMTDTSFIEAGNPPIPFSVIRNKIITAEKYRRRGDYPPCDIKNQWGCPVWYLHDEKEEETVELTPEMEEVLADLVGDYLRLHTLEKEAKVAEEERKERINPSILNMLGKEGKAEIEIEGVGYVVRKQSGNGMRVDLEAMRIAHPDLVEKYEKKYYYDYPVVREKKGKKA